MNNLTDIYNQLKAFAFGLLIFLHIDKDLLVILFSLILVNMVTGGLKAILLESMKFEFEIWWGGLAKKCLLLILILTVGLLARGLGLYEFKPMVTIVMKAMFLSEAIKIMNNIRSVFDKKEHKSSDFISLIIGKLTAFFGFYINKILMFFDKDYEKNN